MTQNCKPQLKVKAFIKISYYYWKKDSNVQKFSLKKQKIN